MSSQRCPGFSHKWPGVVAGVPGFLSQIGVSNTQCWQVVPASLRADSGAVSRTVCGPQGGLSPDLGASAAPLPMLAAGTAILPLTLPALENINMIFFFF